MGVVHFTYPSNPLALSLALGSVAALTLIATLSVIPRHDGGSPVQPTDTPDPPPTPGQQLDCV